MVRIARGSIAVLPFANLSADKKNEYFSDGLAEEMINVLTEVKGLQVRRASCACFAERRSSSEVGGQLNVSTVLEGSVRKAGDRFG